MSFFFLLSCLEFDERMRLEHFVYFLKFEFVFYYYFIHKILKIFVVGE